MTEITRAEKRIEEYVGRLVTHPQERMDTLLLRRLLANLETAVRVTDIEAPF